MKRYFGFVVFFFFLSAASAQKNEYKPKWMSGKGFWNVESNIKTLRTSTIYFYTNSNELVYKETITNRRININRKKVCKRLEAVLVQAVTAWERNKISRENESLVAKRF